jgi:hypothetical protein
MRLAHSIGLHKRGSVFGLTAEESEQRKRVFWIAYMLDREYVLPGPNQTFNLYSHIPVSASVQVDRLSRTMMI